MNGVYGMFLNSTEMGRGALGELMVEGCDMGGGFHRGLSGEKRGKEVTDWSEK